MATLSKKTHCLLFAWALTPALLFSLPISYAQYYQANETIALLLMSCGCLLLTSLLGILLFYYSSSRLFTKIMLYWGISSALCFAMYFFIPLYPLVKTIVLFYGLLNGIWAAMILGFILAACFASLF